jgi:alanine dehydrogenase
VVKVKEPQPEEVARLRAGQTLFTYLHLAPDPELTRGLIDSGATCIAYETVTDARGRLPLLAPMSEVAGKIATQAGRSCSRSRWVAAGCCSAACPASRRARSWSSAAASSARTRGGRDRHGRGDLRLRPLHRPPARPRPHPQLAGLDGLRLDAGRRELLPDVDLVIGAVLVHGARAPHVITRSQLGLMKRTPCSSTSRSTRAAASRPPRPTTHTDPTYEVDGITHYCVANMPGAVPITSTYALTNATMPYVVKLADHGVHAALGRDLGFMDGLNVAAGQLTYEPVARDQGLDVTRPQDALGAVPA